MAFKLPRIFNRGWSVKFLSSEKTYQLLLHKLNANDKFSLSRWGDGEWEAALKLKNQNDANCDGHQFFDSMQESLGAILIKKPTYLLGMQRLAYFKMMGRKIDSFLKKNKLKLNWVAADALHDASMANTLPLFFDALKSKRILLVGPAYLINVKIISFDLIEVPLTNVWLSRDAILKQINERKMNYDVILFCAGMSSNWFVDELHSTFDGFIIDIGSLLDPYAGKTTRTYHKKLKI